MSTRSPEPAVPFAVEADHLTRRFGRDTVVDDVSFAIEPDSIVGLLGRNGAGKTTLMGLLTGQDHPTSGAARLQGRPAWEDDTALAGTCFIREGQTYPNNFRIGHVLASGAAFHPRWDAALADRLVEAFDLPRRRQVQRFSRGMRAAVGIVVGLASRAPLTVFDEPTLGLDATARRQFYDLLIEDYAEQPRTLVLSTHLIDEVGDLLERVLVLDHGRLVLDGPTDDLRGRAVVLSGAAEAVERVAGDAVVLERESLGGQVRLTVGAGGGTAGGADLRGRAARCDVEVTPVSLQSLVVRAGRDDAARVSGASDASDRVDPADPAARSDHEGALR